MSPLERWLAGQLPGARIADTRPLPGGYRNDNLLVVTDGGQRYVLRRYRHGNACAVEAALVERLPREVPVAEVVAVDPDGAAAGEPVLLSRFVAGTMVSEILPDLTREEADQLGRAVGRVLATIGTVTFARPGFFRDADLTPVPVGGLGLETFVAGCLSRRHPDHTMSEVDIVWVRDRAARAAAHLDGVQDSCRLVHADFNPKNLLARRGPVGWAVTAVLDWEFAFCGSPLCDIGNMLRFAEDYPPGYADGFLAGFGEAGGHLPTDWREVSRALDLYALAEFLTRPASDVSRRAVALLRTPDR
jgi:aminoglycoside phosphotransferase (APT) family kinase protein